MEDFLKDSLFSWLEYVNIVTENNVFDATREVLKGLVTRGQIM